MASKQGVVAGSLRALAIALAAALLAVVAGGHASAQPGLVAAYSFNEGSGSTVADSSGNGNIGTLSNVAWTTQGRFGRALVFNGTSSVVRVNSSASLQLTTGMTLEAWVYPTIALSGWKAILQKQTDAYFLTASSPQNAPASGGTLNGSCCPTVVAPASSALRVNVWTHVASTYNGSQLRLYINGSLVASTAASGSFQVNSNPLRIGGNTYGGEFFRGRIDEVRIYHRPLTQAEIQADMNRAVGGGGGGSDATAPTIQITGPTSGATYATSASPLTLSGTAGDNVGVTQVSWVNDRGGSGTAAGTTTWSASGIALQSGANVLTVTARDAAGNTATDTLTVTYSVADTTAPTVIVSAPGAGATVGGVVTVAATASDNVAVAGVQFLLDGAPLGAEVTAAPYSMSWNTAGAANGGHTLSARAHDGAGNTTVSADVPVTVANTQVSGLVAAYSFNEGSGGTVADASWSGNTGTLSNATWTMQGRFGSALAFNGSNSVVVVNGTASLNLTTGMTLEAWVYPTAALSNWKVIIQKQTDAYFLAGSSPQNAPASGGTLNGSCCPTVFAPASAALPVNTWTHVASTYDGTQLRLYINGAFVASTSAAGSLEVNGNALRIGGNTYAGEFFTGRIDEVRIYNRALTQAEIQADMNTPVGGGGGGGGGSDTTPPTVAITAPAAGATVAGVVTVSASASDNVAVAGVQFLLDGAPLGAEVTSGPHAMSWNTGGTTNGGHTLSARARDSAGNTAVSPDRTVTVANTQVSGLVAAYAFNEGSGGTVADASGSNNTGTLSNATWTAQGRFGSALAFNGSNSVVVVNGTASLNLTTGMTLEAWVYPTAALSNWQVIIQKQTDAYFLAGSSPQNAPASGGTLNGSCCPTVFAPASAALPVNTWTHVASTYNGAQWRLYLNGALISSTAATGSLEVNGNALRIGGNTYAGEFFTGRIDEVRIYNRALTQAEIQADMNTPVGGGGGGGGGGSDTTPPTVAITGPTSGATYTTAVSPLTLSGTAGDNVGVTQVSWVNNRGGSGTAAGTTTWSASGIALQSGTNVLTATARDAAGNTAVATLTVTYTGTGPSLVGQWANHVSWPLVAVHMMMLRNGQILVMDDHTNTTGNTGVWVWNPATESFVTSAPYFADNLFCSGHAALPDGRMLVIGGHVYAYGGIPDTTIFNPSTLTWSAGPSMSVARWYPTATTLPDGRVLATSGSISCLTCIAEIPEIYDPAANTWTSLPSTARLSLPLYPHMFVLPDGRVLAASTQEDPIATAVLDLTTRRWSTVDPAVLDGGSAAMYLPGKIIKSGSARNPDYSPAPAAATTYVLDMTQPSPRWRQAASMAFPRTQHNLTLLPDGTVLATGGARNSDVYDLSAAVYEAELWSPATETWTTMARMARPRLYHSTALLLPDARVLVAGGGRFGVDELTAQIYSPPYLFRGPRPVIGSAPPQIQYGTPFFVGTSDASRIASVALIRLGSVTHAFDQDQRFLNLDFVESGGGLTIDAPSSATLAPPGHYMLFILDENDVPSVARILRVQ